MRTLLIVLGAVVAAWAALILILYAIGWRKMRQFVAIVPDVVRLLRDLALDARVPRHSRLLVLGAAAWVASPIDIVPEFIPFLGPLDDVVVVMLVLRHLVRRSGAQIVTSHWRGDEAGLHRVLRLAGVPAAR